MHTLYKFRPLDKYAIDILAHNRLFLSDWESLNDPHEAKMLVDTPDLNLHMNPRGLKEHGFLDELPAARVCSLSGTWSSNLLWSHYAGGQSGIAIGVKIPEEMDGVERLEVVYDDRIPVETPPLERASVLRALKHKSSEWGYEQETRLISFDKERRFLEGIEISEVIFGLRTDKSDIALVNKVADSRAIAFWRICHKPGTYKLNKSSISFQSKTP